MTERSIVEAATRLRRHGEPYLVATVVNVHGSAYRKPGARMLLTRFRWVAGTASGGSLEGDLSNQAWWRTRDGDPSLLQYDCEHDDAADDDDIRSVFGLGCDGVVEVLLERVGAAGRLDALEVASRCFRAKQRGAVATVYRRDDTTVRLGARLALVGGALELDADIEAMLDIVTRERIAADLRIAVDQGVSLGRSYATQRGTIDVFVEAIVPPQRLFLVGTGHDAVPVAQLARTLGWDVFVFASTPKFTTRDRFAMATEVITDRDALLARIAESDRAVGIVMTHDRARDREGIELLAPTQLATIGILGTPERAMRLSSDPRVRGIGLALGAETPHEVAMAMISELRAALVRTGLFDQEPRVITVAPMIVQERIVGTGTGSATALAAAPIS